MGFIPLPLLVTGEAEGGRERYPHDKGGETVGREAGRQREGKLGAQMGPLKALAGACADPPAPWSLQDAPRLPPGQPSIGVITMNRLIPHGIGR